MAILDRFRASPRSKHPDASVRLAYVEELPIDDRDQLASIARDDDDPRVRRAAVSKLIDPPALAGVAREDCDEAVRDQALEMLRDIALEVFEGIGEPESLAALDAIGDPKTLALVARSAPRETVALRALARIDEVRTLASLARHAALEPVRRAALDRVPDHDDILAVAMNSDFKDTALAALDRLTDRADLEQVASRARSKSAAKRARGLVREIEDRAAAEAAAAAPPVEAAPPAATPIRDHQAEEQAAEVQRRAADEARARAEAAARHAEAQAQRRQEAEAALEKEAARRRARLAELADEAGAAAADADLAAGKRRLEVARREWKDVSLGVAIDPQVGVRFAEAESRMTAREAEAQDTNARLRREALARMQQFAARVETLLERHDLALKTAEHALRDVRSALADVPPLPSRHDFEAISRRLKAAQAALVPRVAELREADEWRRFANVSVQEQLCAKMEALKALGDPEAIVRQVRELQQAWRQAADVPRAQADALWRRFKAAHDEVWTRCEAHFAAQAQARAANLAKKTALCERAEVLADSSNWIQTAEEIKRLQAEWKTIGAVSRGQEKAIWERFRTACDRFFTRRHQDLVQRKAMWAANFAKKQALCERAEALADSTDWEPAAADLRRLQAEWKTIGPVKKTRSEAIWQRFRGACDRFFTRYAQRHDIAKAERVAAREALCAELESLSVDSPQSTVDSPSELLARVRALRTRWQQELAARGVDRERAIALDARFQAAFDRLLALRSDVFAGTDFDPESNRRRMDALVRRVEALAASVAPGAAFAAAGDAALPPTTRLAAMLKEALAANTIGGKVDEETRWRAAQEEVRQAQASWTRIGPVPDEARGVLTDRFQRACAAIMRAGGPGRPGGSGRPGGPGR